MSEGSNKLSDYGIVAYQSNDGNHQFVQIGKIKYRIVDDDYLQSLETKLVTALKALEYIDSVACKTDSRLAHDLLKVLKGDK